MDGVESSLPPGGRGRTRKRALDAQVEEQLAELVVCAAQTTQQETDVRLLVTQVRTQIRFAQQLHLQVADLQHQTTALIGMGTGWPVGERKGEERKGQSSCIVLSNRGEQRTFQTRYEP